MAEKIYLSKSNAADPNLVHAVRELLKKKDCEVKEFTGSKYTNSDKLDMLSCNWLLIVPPVNPAPTANPTSINVGRGQYEQIDAFIAKHSTNEVVIVNKVLEDKLEIQLYSVENLDILTYDYTHNYGRIELLTSDYGREKKADICLLEDLGVETKVKTWDNTWSIPASGTISLSSLSTTSTIVDTNHGAVYLSDYETISNIKPILAASLFI